MSVACPIQPYSQSGLVEVVERILPDEYTSNLTVGTGKEIFEMDAAVMARVSEAAAHLGCGLFMLTAESPEYATGTVTFSRPSDVYDLVVIEAGSIVRASSVDRRFITTANGVLNLGDLSVTVPIRSIEAAYQYNLEETNLVDQPVKLLLDPPFGDPTIYISASSITTEGVWGSINALGADRGYPRVQDEPTESYRRRIRDLPDTVSVGAIRRTVEQFWDSKYPAYPATIIEGWEEDAQICLDFPTNLNGLALDDTRAEPPLHGRLLSRETVTNGFAVCIQRPSGITDDEFNSATAALWFAIQATKAAGIAATILLLPWEP